MKIGVLALQGAFLEHKQKLSEINIESFEIRNKKDLQQDMQGIILPGGESTAIGKLLKDLNMFDSLKGLISDGLPAFGTCAGLILLAKKIEGCENSHLGLMDITAKRNAYGRQLGSFYTESEFEGIGKIPMTFIRAPYISKVGPKTNILSVVNNKIVAAKEDNMLVTSFHPEITSSNSVHNYFIQNFCKS
ncbi:pyridoxal 5'-phosphate synthase glutaminase subunit PdxT [Apibacter muscae]|uniref:Pyridoxal 5'-phosphate synthase subunit PdxT n=1 Tax=Apibacter muscae TaxID=2509004 RepID=A0A563DB47_9FLAO|nr:pyridoxal 5'-phosphate synthase glutaminase subunit PdxT [Apibacter muscae]TWP27445.1 pyridoxal 5'-phosphate synthase glutaminase subunit PdxT [Apibacter muscae]TWP28861.1 pyridoxal 5'-phosphate synthase glutaminase subunit PdxT [Apibacter muscae]